MSKKKTEIQRAYDAQVRRLKNFAKGIKKRGYNIDIEKIIGERIGIKKRRTRKQIENLKKLKPELLYYKATYTTTTGEVIKGSERRKQERQEAAKKGLNKVRDYRVIIYHFKARLRSLETDNTKEVVAYLLDWIDKIVEDYGLKNTASMLEQGTKDGILIDYKDLYKGDLLEYYLEKLINNLDITQFMKDILIDKIDEEIWDILPDE